VSRQLQSPPCLLDGALRHAAWHSFLPGVIPGSGSGSGSTWCDARVWFLCTPRPSRDAGADDGALYRHPTAPLLTFATGAATAGRERCRRRACRRRRRTLPPGGTPPRPVCRVGGKPPRARAGGDEGGVEATVDGCAMADGSTSGRGVREAVGMDFLAAARAGNVGAVEAAVADDSSVVFFLGGSRDETALHIAAVHGHKEVVEVLLRAHAAVDAEDNLLFTPLHGAAHGGHEKVAEVLLRAHAAVDAKGSRGVTPLHVAAENGHKDVAELLLRADARVDAVFWYGWTPLRLATRNKKLDVVRLLLEWRADPANFRPHRARAGLSPTSKLIRDAFDEAVPMTEQELGSAKAAWRAVANAAGTDVAAADPVSHALVALQAVYDGFVAAPDTLSVDALEAALTPPDDRDVRWHVLAHRVLLYAARVGIFGAETAREKAKRRIFWFGRIYGSMMSVLSPCDRVIVSALVRDAEENGLLELYHISDVDVGLELHDTFYAEVVDIHRCLADLREEANCAGQQLRAAIKQLDELGRYMVDKEARQRKVALAKSAVKIGVSLAPVVGSILGVTVDVVAELADGLPGGAAAVVRCLADPTNMAAARQVLVMVGNVEDRLSPAQTEQLSEAVHPFESVAALEGELGSVATVLELPSGKEGEGILDAVSDTAGDGEAGEAASDAGSDPLEDFQGTTRDAAIEQGVDMADELRSRAASLPAVPPAAHPPPSAGGVGRTTPPPPSASPSVATPAAAAASHFPPSTGAGSGAFPPAAPPAPPAVPADGAGAAPQPPAATPRSSDAVFFARARDWTDAEVAERLVERVARVYDAPKRAELAAIVRAAAAKHCVTGESLVRSPDPPAMAVCLLGDWERRVGVLVSVTSFIEDVQRFAAQ